MTDYSVSKATELRLNRILEQIDSNYVRQRIDVPVALATQSFQMPARTSAQPDLNSYLIATMGAFLQNLYATGIRSSLYLQPDEAEAVALRIIQREYKGGTEDGYDAALCDVYTFGVKATEFVLRFLADAVRIREQALLTRRVLMSELSALSWAEKVALGSAIRDRLLALEGVDYTEGRPERFANHLSTLVLKLVAAIEEARPKASF